ncbi:hypothetical protein DZK27_15080 [Rhodobacteraceae bacterium 63075]|nr:hypothetical protein DZK27_15080 [Rhodobacteraceae bacterium 63075]
MRQIFSSLAVVLALVAPPAFAQEEDGGTSLMEEGARLFMEGIMKEVDPAVKELQKLLDDMQPAFRDFAKEMGPALAELMDEVEDWSAYHPPEILPNGDIILRRKEPEAPGEEPLGEGEIEL